MVKDKKDVMNLIKNLVNLNEITRESALNELSELRFDSESEATDILKIYGFEEMPYGSGGTWYINTTLHLTCRIKYEGGGYWKLAFSSPVSSHNTGDVDALFQMKFYARCEAEHILSSYGFEETAFAIFTNSRTHQQCHLKFKYDHDYGDFYWKVMQ